jgi:hypothetical protein
VTSLFRAEHQVVIVDAEGGDRLAVEHDARA